MHRASVNIVSALLFHQTDGLKERAGGIYLVVHDNGGSSSNLADKSQTLHTPVVAQAAFLDNGQRSIEALSEVAGLLGEAGVGGDNGEVAELPGLDVPSEDVLGGELVHGDAKEALNLASVQVHR